MAAALLPTPALGAYPTYSEVDYVTVRDFSLFDAIWNKAATQNVRLAIIGDSQERSPGGAGSVFIPRLNYEFLQHFGKVGESFVAPMNGNYGSGSPPANWLLRGAHGSSTGVSAAAISASQVLPGAQAARYTSSAYGQLTMLDPFNSGINAGTGIRDVQVWNNAETLQATIFARQFPGSDEVAWRASPTTSTSPSFFLGNSATGTTSMGLDSQAGGIISQTVGPLPWGGGSRQQLIVKGAGSAGADMVGVRFTNPDSPGGVSVQSFSAGGYRTTSLLSNHAEAGPMLAAFGPWDAIIVHTGVNDAYNGVTAETFKTNLETLIDTIRGPSWLDNPTQNFILCTDPYRAGGSTIHSAEFDQYAGVLAELALADEFIMAVNSRRWTTELGWNAAGYSEFLSDGVHYTAAGATMLASVEASLMLYGKPVPEPGRQLTIAAIVAAGLSWAAFRRRAQRKLTRNEPFDSNGQRPALGQVSKGNLP